MNKIFKNMTKTRKNLGDHLQMLKTKHKYYPEVVLDVGVADGTPELYEAFSKSYFVLFEPLDRTLGAYDKNSFFKYKWR